MLLFLLDLHSYLFSPTYARPISIVRRKGSDWNKLNTVTQGKAHLCTEHPRVQVRVARKSNSRGPARLGGLAARPARPVQFAARPGPGTKIGNPRPGPEIFLSLMGRIFLDGPSWAGPGRAALVQVLRAIVTL